MSEVGEHGHRYFTKIVDGVFDLFDTDGECALAVRESLTTDERIVRLLRQWRCGFHRACERAVGPLRWQSR